MLSKDEIEKELKIRQTEAINNLGNELYECPECHLLMSVSEITEEEHLRWHTHILETNEKYGPLLFIAERGKLKGISSIFNKSGRPIEERIFGALLYLMCHFYRSVENYGPDHPPFSEYVAMRLKNKDNLSAIVGDEEMYNKLVERFGVKEGIPKGSYYGI